MRHAFLIRDLLFVGLQLRESVGQLRLQRRELLEDDVIAASSALDRLNLRCEICRIARVEIVSGEDAVQPSIEQQVEAALVVQ